MDAEIKEILDQHTEMLEENNALLHKLRRAQLFSNTLWFIKWGIILGSGFGLYYYFQPQISHFMELYNKAFTNIQGFNQGVGELIKSIK